MGFGEIIKRIRREKGLTQSQLGERLHISQSAVGQFEKRTDCPKMDTVAKFAQALEVDPNEIILEYNAEINRALDEIEEDLKNNKTKNAQVVYNDIIFNGTPKTIEEFKKIREFRTFIENDTIIDLMEQYNKLNAAGQDKVINYTTDLAGNPEYRKDSNE